MSDDGHDPRARAGAAAGLIDNVPSERRVEAPAATLLNGPQISPEGKPDVVSDQAQVDELTAAPR